MPSRETPIASSIREVPVLVNDALDGIYLEYAVLVAQFAVSASETLATVVVVLETSQLNLTV